MPRINSVKKARKEGNRCGRCGDAIEKGMPYRWIKFRYGGRHVRCEKISCGFRSSELTSSDKLSRVYGAQEQVEDLCSGWDKESLEDLKSELEEPIQEIRDVGQEYQESADNIREHFSESEKADECEEKAQELEQWADELETAKDGVDDWPEDDEDEDDEESESKEEKKNADGQTRDEWAAAVVEEIEGANSCPI
jgi:DNA repair exonuclease SbcCD ATPase subunit